MKLAKIAGVESTVLALSEEEKVFEELFTQKIDTETVKESGRVREQRAVITERINNLLVWLGANAADLPGQYASTADQVNTLIKTTMTPARSRASKKAAESAV